MPHRVGLVFITLCMLVAVVTTSANSRTRLAPADEYFGRMKMSPLEITNRINDAERGRASYIGLLNTQGAIEDWAGKYPADPWIAPREFRMARLFARLHSAAAASAAARCRAFLRTHYPHGRYGRP